MGSHSFQKPGGSSQMKPTDITTGIEGYAEGLGLIAPVAGAAIKSFVKPVSVLLDAAQVEDSYKKDGLMAGPSPSTR